MIAALAGARLVVRGVGLDELLLLRRNFVEREDRVRRAHGNAGAAVNAVRGVDVQVGDVVKPRLVLARMDAVHGTNLDAFFVFGASVYDDVSHGCYLPGGSKTPYC
jgi:hypothetical protein